MNWYINKITVVYRDQATNEVKNKLVNINEVAMSILKIEHQKIETGSLINDVARKNALEIISKLRFDDGRGYFWINDAVTSPAPNMIMHPIAPQLNGKVLENPKYNCALGNKTNLFVAMANVCNEKGEGFVDYVWPDPKNKENTLSKISYVKFFKPWGMIKSIVKNANNLSENVIKLVDSSKIVRENSVTMGNNMNEVSSAVDEASGSSNNIATAAENVQQFAVGLEEISNSVTATNKLSQDSRTVSEEIENKISDFENEISELKGVVGKFKIEL